MVKRLLLVACMLLSINMLHAQEKIKTTAEQVTFYIDGAQVTRTKTLNLTAGETTLLFTGMSPYMDAKSMLYACTHHIAVHQGGDNKQRHREGHIGGVRFRIQRTENTDILLA